MKIAVGLSGGVDSSVVAALLREAGHEVVGITMKLWQGKYRGGAKDACFGPGEEEDIRCAESLCRQLGIEHRVFDCGDEYERRVLDNFRKEYLAGRTPNPCIRCNAFLKFGLLPTLARKAGLEFDKFATGHYARIREENGVFHLLRGVDETKDQSYFLYRLAQHQLSGLLFPLGGKRKTEVRELARRFGLAVQAKGDSQDFYSGDHTELLREPDRPGKIVDLQGNELGTHNGFWHFTVGQRKGLGIASPHPYYVLELRSCANEVVVGSQEDTRHKEVTLSECHWIVEPPTGYVQVKIRSAAKLLPAEIREQTLVFPDGVQAAAKGQSAVLYRDEELLGGGLIDSVCC